MLNDLLHLLFGFQVVLPADFATLFRALVMLEGSQATLKPDYALSGTVIPARICLTSSTQNTPASAPKDGLVVENPTSDLTKPSLSVPLCRTPSHGRGKCPVQVIRGATPYDRVVRGATVTG
jgi:hypothetical protein